MIYQITYGISYGDAVGNEIMAIHRMLKMRGIPTEIRAERVSRRMSIEPAVRKLNDSVKPSPSDTIIFHVTCGCDLNLKVFEYGCRVVLRYHNITPPEFFEGFNDSLRDNSVLGREQLKEMAGKTAFVLADSGYNRDDLISLGFTCQVHVVPILMKPIKPGRTAPDLHRILSVGRIAPHKRVDSVIKAFAEYQRVYDNRAVLIIAGSDKGLEKCSHSLKEFCGRVWGESPKRGENSGLRPPYFAGHITNARLKRYFRSAGLYVTMSEHEGFCVPVVEAMEYGIPVIAAGSSAIPETLGGSGILLEDRDPAVVSEAMHRAVSDAAYREQIIAGQRSRA
ncbi:MAG: glycosyltransferase family 4 protein, partial [Lachnospiraceae bacterium]|nr:glycosyltransferase family 4 protein [Lachnospiraceae bacterium]